MNDESLSLPGLSDIDERVHQLVDEFVRRLAAGEHITPDEFAASHLEHADELRALLPAVSVMFAFGRDAEPSSNQTPELSVPMSGYLGDFRIVREIGRGGMGVVYEAEQVSLGRRVALKVLPFGALLDDQQLRRFKNEAHAAAMLQHPHIVSVFYVGCERGVHFYAMPFIEGRDLQEIVAHARGITGSGVFFQGERAGPGARSVDLKKDSRPPSATISHDAATHPIAQLDTVLSSPIRLRSRQVAEFGIQAAQALDYAHREGVIHRDIKPSNLLIDKDGKLWITDFGLARVQGRGDSSAPGQNVVGTLRYMSPEQLAGDCVVDQRTDVYSLGITLYELLTLRPAFVDHERPQLVRRILEHEPTPIRQIDSTIPPDLATIIERAISKEREQRYQSAQALADDLQCYLDDRPIMARPISRIGRVWRWYKRSPVVAGLSVGIMLLSMLLASTASVLAVREVRQREREVQQRQAAEADARESRWQQYLSDMHSAMAAWEQSNVGHTLELLERHRPKRGEPDLRGFEWNYLSRQCQDNRLKLTINETSFVRGMSFSHDGHMLATGNQEGLVRVWDATSGWLIHEFNGQPTAVNVVNRVAFSPDDRILASGDADGTIHLCELTDSRTSRTLTGHTATILRLLFSSDGKQLASSGEDTTVRIWDVATGRELKMIRPPLRKPSPTWLVSPWTGNRFWVFARDGLLRQFDTDTGIELRSIERKEFSRAQSLARVSWDGRLVATSGPDGVVQLLETETGRDLETLGAHGAEVRWLAFAPDDQTLASSDAQGKVILWDLAQRTRRAVLRGHSGLGWPLDFSNDGQRLCTSGGDHKLRIWDVTQQPSDADILQSHDYHVLCVAFSPNGRTLASGGAEADGGLVKLWDVATGRLMHQFKGHTAWVSSVAFSPDGKELASSGGDGTVRLWDLTQPSMRTTIDPGKGLNNWISWVSYSRDGKQLVSSEQHGMLRVWDRGTGTEIRSAQIGQSHAWTPALSPDGRYLVAGVDQSIVWLEYPSLKTIRRFPRSPVYGSVVAFSPDGRMIATCDMSSNHVHLSTFDGSVLGTLDHAANVWCVDFSPDGRTLATGDTNHEVHIWDVQRRQERATLRGHFAWIDMVRFSPDGKTIASSGDDGTIRLWRSEPPD